ncbi:MAG: hypothetical protein HOP23_15905 [Methylococcaceae bacterium]|nr:hypothetical protein [Methylococcaceae bacterium]
MVIFLALLQFVAPLVHAHAGEERQTVSTSWSANLHIPGLESYAVEYKTLMLVPASHQYDATGVIVSVDSGIQQKQAYLIDDPDDGYMLPPQLVATHSSFSFFDSNFSPHVPIRISWFLPASHTPRAPPAQ